nr:hypothetical protein CFP56_17080 [Quercus suber]
MGFNDVENSVEPIMFQNRNYRFDEGWMAAVTAIGLPEVSPFRNPDQIPYLEPPPPPTRNPTEAEDEDTSSMRKLVQATDSHAELIDLEITSNPSIVPTSANPNQKIQIFCNRNRAKVSLKHEWEIQLNLNLHSQEV